MGGPMRRSVRQLKQVDKPVPCLQSHAHVCSPAAAHLMREEVLRSLISRQLWAFKGELPRPRHHADLAPAKAAICSRSSRSTFI